MSLFRSLVIAFACFSRLPMPGVDWEPDAMRYSLCFLPLVGLVVGLLTWGWLALSAWLGLGALLRATGVLLVSLAVTGGIHLDGFADVVDAQSSHADPQRKRQILKDPHTGAFALVGVATYLLTYVALASELVLDPGTWPLLCCLPWMSRCLAGLASLVLPRSGNQGMLASFGGSADKRVACVVLVAEGVLGAIWLMGCHLLAGALVCLGGLACLAWLGRFARREFGGMSGDLAGFLVQVSEAVMLACLVVAARLVMAP